MFVWSSSHFQPWYASLFISNLPRRSPTLFSLSPSSVVFSQGTMNFFFYCLGLMNQRKYYFTLVELLHPIHENRRTSLILKPTLSSEGEISNYYQLIAVYTHPLFLTLSTSWLFLQLSVITLSFIFFASICN